MYVAQYLQHGVIYRVRRTAWRDRRWSIHAHSLVYQVPLYEYKSPISDSPLNPSQLSSTQPSRIQVRPTGPYRMHVPLLSPGGLVCCTTPPVETAQLLPHRLLKHVDDLPLLKLANLKDTIFFCWPKLVSQHGRPLRKGLWLRNWFSFLSTLPLSTLYQGVLRSAGFLVAFPHQSACCTPTFQETLICGDSSCE